MVVTDNLGMNVGTSRGFMDNKSAGENTYILDQVAGAMPIKRFVAAINPSLFVDDTWTYVAMPSDLTEELTDPNFDDGQARVSNLVKVLCARFRIRCNTGTNTGTMQFQLRKGGNTAPVANELLINSVPARDNTTTVQNVSGIGKPAPQTPVVGNDKDGISLWIKKDVLVGETDMDVEILIAAQMVPGTPPNFLET
jgi:hypothetical protein